jgi:hypothetical protein
MLGRLAAIKPKAHVLGFTVQRMVRWPGAHDLIIIWNLKTSILGFSRPSTDSVAPQLTVVSNERG